MIAFAIWLVLQDQIATLAGARLTFGNDGLFAVGAFLCGLFTAFMMFMDRKAYKASGPSDSARRAQKVTENQKYVDEGHKMDSII